MNQLPRKTKCKYSKTRISSLMTSYKFINYIRKLLSSLQALSQLRSIILSKSKLLQMNNFRKFNKMKKLQTTSLRQHKRTNKLIRKTQYYQIFPQTSMKTPLFKSLTNCHYKSKKLYSNSMKLIGAVRCQTKKANMDILRTFMCMNFIRFL